MKSTCFSTAHKHMEASDIYLFLFFWKI